MTSKKLKSAKPEEHLSSHKVGELLGYTHDYVSRLCRQGHMVGERRGREWFVKPSDIEDFKKRHEVILQEKKKQLSQKLSEIRKQHEAQKRAQKQVVQIKSQKDPVKEPQVSIPTSSDLAKVSYIATDTKAVKLSIPKQLVAVCVLACVLVIPTFINLISSTPVAPIAKAPIAPRDFQTANIVDSFGASVAQLPIETITTFSEIGHTFIYIYELQGKLTTQSLGDISSVGAITLSGYELVGESFIEGVQNTSSYYLNIFAPAHTSYNSFMDRYMNNLYQGYIYAFEQGVDVVQNLTGNVTGGYQILAQNFVHNFTSTNQAIGQLSSSLYASIGSVLDNSKPIQEDTIEVIKIKQKDF